MLKILLFLMAFTLTFGLPTQKPCHLRKFNAGYVCVCTQFYCDTLNIPKLDNENKLMLVTTTESGQRFNISFGEFNLQYDNNSSTTFMEIKKHVLYHEIIGFGGSVTGAVSYILNKLPKNLRECIYKSYYTNDDGLGYTLMRMPMGGCDFDQLPWAYNEYPENDMSLTNFTKLHPKDTLRTELIKELMNVSQNFDIKVIGVTWSPPRWMKEKGEWPGKNDNRLKVKYYQTWADYYVKWLDLMQVAEIPIWAVSTGNEPFFAQFTSFMGLTWNASSQAKWIENHLGPTLKNSKYSSVHIHTFDDNRDLLTSWLDEMKTSAEGALDYVSAFGVHGYFDKVTSPSILDETKAQYPNKSILYTEMCFSVTGPLSTTGPTLGTWKHFEELTDMLMETLKHNVNGFLDWNIILDIRGGPNYINNVVDAMMIVNDDFTEIYKQPTFYAAAHFTKFILPGSKRIEAHVSGDNTENLNSLAFLRPDSKVAIILYNRHAKNTVYLQIYDKLKGTIGLQLKPKSLNSVIYSI